MISSKSVLIVLMLATAVLAETAVQFVQVHDDGNGSMDHETGRQTTTVVTNSRWWPYGWGWGWGWGIAIFVLAIVKGSILLGLFIIWTFFHGFGKKKGCAPIIIRESSPSFSYDHPPFAPWDRTSPPEEIIRSKRSAQDYRDSELYWTDLITDIGFSFLGVHSKDCRKRFVCEVDVRSRQDPWINFAMNMFGVDIFRKYRSNDDKAAKSIEECSAHYGKCKHTATPSISFAMISGHIDPLTDYDEGLLNGEETTEETTETVEVDSTVTEPVTTTTTEVPQKKYFNKRKRFFKVDKL